MTLARPVLIAIGRGSIAVTHAAVEATANKRGAPKRKPLEQHVAPQHSVKMRNAQEGQSSRLWPEIDDELALARGIAVLAAGGLPGVAAS